MFKSSSIEIKALGFSGVDKAVSHVNSVGRLRLVTMLRSIYKFVFLLAIVAGRVTSTALSVSAPDSVPSSASRYVDHAFGSFSIAVHWFVDYAGMKLLEHLIAYLF